MRHASSRMLWVSVMAFVHEHIERVCRMFSARLQMHYDIRTAPFVTCLFYFEFINRSHTCQMPNAPPLFVRFVRTQIARCVVILDMIPILPQSSFRPAMSTYFISSLCTISGVSIIYVLNTKLQFTSNEWHVWLVYSADWNWKKQIEIRSTGRFRVTWELRTALKVVTRKHVNITKPIDVIEYERYTVEWIAKIYTTSIRTSSEVQTHI